VLISLKEKTTEHFFSDKDWLQPTAVTFVKTKITKMKNV
jgi:hypothetical protein